MQAVKKQYVDPTCLYCEDSICDQCVVKNKETPKHYDKDIQPWDYMQVVMSEEAYKGFLWGNVIKYMSRWEEKGGVADLKKAQNYLEMMIRHVS